MALLTLLNHPLVMAGDERLSWLDGVRRLDLALRGPRPPAGLAGVAAHLAVRGGRDDDVRIAAETWWQSHASLLEPLEQAFGQSEALADLLGALRQAALALGGEGAWAGPSGRAAADLFASLEPASAEGPIG